MAGDGWRQIHRAMANDEPQTVLVWYPVPANTSLRRPRLRHVCAVYAARAVRAVRAVRGGLVLQEVPTPSQVLRGFVNELASAEDSQTADACEPDIYYATYSTIGEEFHRVCLLSISIIFGSPCFRCQGRIL